MKKSLVVQEVPPSSCSWPIASASEVVACQVNGRPHDLRASGNSSLHTRADPGKRWDIALSKVSLLVLHDRVDMKLKFACLSVQILDTTPSLYPSSGRFQLT